MDPILAASIFKRALNEKLAFVPGGQQAPGPDGAPVPQPGAEPAPPGADPAGAASPGAAPGGAPVDPNAPPAAPMDMPPPPQAGAMDLASSGGKAVTPEQAETVMQIVERTLEAVGKKKTAKPEGAADPNAMPGDPAADPAAQPGPITGMPGFDPSSIKGPLPTPGA